MQREKQEGVRACGARLFGTCRLAACLAAYQSARTEQKRGGCTKACCSWEWLHADAFGAAC